MLTQHKHVCRRRWLTRREANVSKKKYNQTFKRNREYFYVTTSGAFANRKKKNTVIALTWQWVYSFFSILVGDFVLQSLFWVPHCCSVPQSYLTFCDPVDCSMLGFPVLHCFPEFPQTHVHWVIDAIQLSYPLLLPSPAISLSQCIHLTPGGLHNPVSSWHSSTDCCWF